MELSLSQIGFLLLILSGAARLLLLTVPLVKFIQIFDKKIVEGSRLLNSLEIPGLRRFVRDEIGLGFTPYVALYGAVNRPLVLDSGCCFDTVLFPITSSHCFPLPLVDF